MDLEAERLQHCLDRIAAGEPASDVVQAVAGQPGGDDLARLVAFTANLAEVLPERADAAFRARLQAQLQAEIAARPQARPQARPGGHGSTSTSPSLLRWQPWFLRLCAAVVVVALAMGTAVKASANSLPGGALYPVKRAAEEARLALAWTATLRAQVQLDIANTRIDEISMLVGRDVPVDPVVIDVLVVAYGGLAGPAGAVVDPAWAAEVARTRAEHGQVLDALARTTDDADLGPRVASARRALDDAAAQLDAGLPQGPPSVPAGSTAGPTASPTTGSAAASSGVAPPTATATGVAKYASRTPAPGPILTRQALRTPAVTATGIPRGPAPTDALPPAPAPPTAPHQPSASPPTAVPPTAAHENNPEPTRGPSNPAADERATEIARRNAAARDRGTREAATKPPPTAARPNRTPRADGTPDRPISTEVSPSEPTREASPPLGTP